MPQTGHSHAMWEPSVDGSLDEVGRDERERHCHVHLPHTAALTGGNAFGVGREW